MKCPNCGKEYTEDQKLCPSCHTPLSNAIYSPVETKRRRKRPLVLVSVLVLVLALLGIGGYQYYLYQVRSQCRKVTEQVFTCAKNMDFSELASYGLPEPLKSEPNVKKLVKQTLASYVEDSGVSDYINLDEIDTDTLCDEIAADATYEIKDVSATYNKCTVTVKTGNFDLTTLPNTLYQKAAEELANSISGESIWNGIKDTVSAWITGEEKAETETIDLTDKLVKWYEEAREEGAQKTTTGKIVYGMKDGKWTLLSFDEDLIYTFYGIGNQN